MNKDKILANLETAVDKNGNIPMRLVRQAFEKLPELCEDAVSRRDAIDAIGEVHPLDYNAQTIKSRIENLPPVQPKTCEDTVSKREAIGE